MKNQEKMPGRVVGYFFAIYKGTDEKVPLEANNQYSIAMFDQLKGKHKKSNLMVWALGKDEQKTVVVYDTFKSFFQSWDMVMSPELAREASEALTK